MLWKLSNIKVPCVACQLPNTIWETCFEDGFRECIFTFSTECGALRRIHNVQGLWTATAKGFEKSRGCEIEA